MYVAVKGGEKAIASAHRYLAEERRGDPALPDLAVDQIAEQLGHAVSRVMAEGSLYDRALAALARLYAQEEMWTELADIQFFYVDPDILRKICGQTAHFDNRNSVEKRTTSLDTNAACLIEKVQRYIGAQFLGCSDPLKIHMLDERLGRMALQILQDHILLLITDYQCQNVRVKSLSLQMMRQFVMNQAYHAWRPIGSSIKYPRHQTLTTQAAARTFTLVFTVLRVDFKKVVHDDSKTLSKIKNTTTPPRPVR